MKRLIIVFLIIFAAFYAKRASANDEAQAVLAGKINAAYIAQTGDPVFTPNMGLIKLGEPSYDGTFYAVYNKNGKKLIYLAAQHGAPKTLNMVYHIFEKYKPDVAVVEFEREDRPLKDHAYEVPLTAKLAIKNKIPFVKADLATDDWYQVLKLDNYSYNDFQGFMIIRTLFAGDYPGRKTAAEQLEITQHLFNKDLGKRLTPEGFLDWFKTHFKGDYYKIDLPNLRPNPYAPSLEGFITNRMSLRVSLKGRDPFMLANIAAALNKKEYDTVFMVSGGGHYDSLAPALEKMLGKPKIIKEIKKNYAVAPADGKSILTPKTEVLVPFDEFADKYLK